MTVKQALSRARDMLVTRNIEDPSLESELLLRHVLNRTRVQLYSGFSDDLTPGEEVTFFNLVQRRLSGEPTAYITEHREFYGLDFFVDRRVLIPRPESELLVEKTRQLAETYPFLMIADIGTGCGAIAISLALNLPQAKIYATDTSRAALNVARINHRKHGLANSLYLLYGDMLDPLPEPVDIIIANLPYVTQSDLSLVNTLDFEPTLALDGGSDGLEKIRKLVDQVSGKLNDHGHLLLEIGQGQKNAVTALLHDLFPAAEIEVTPDLSGIDRVIRLSLV